MSEPAFSFISRDSIPVPKQLLSSLPSRLSFDNGATLCKILYATESEETGQLHFLTVRRADFAAAIRWIKSQLAIECPVVKMTGVNFAHQELFKEEFNASCEHVIEVLTLVRGCHWMVSNLPDDQAFLPPGQPDELYRMDVKNELLEGFMNTFKIEGSDSDDQKFPAVLANIGSTNIILSLDAEGKMAGFHFTMLSGKIMQGLAQLLIGTNDYDEIMALAEQGDRSRVDLLIGEVFTNDPNSPYGQLKGDIPMLHFGKAAEGRVAQGSARREDLARSLVSLLCQNILATLMSICSLTQVPRVYFGGNFFRHPIARREFENGKAIFAGQQSGGGGGFRHRFLRNGGHAGAVGALVASNMDAPVYLKLG